MSYVGRYLLRVFAGSLLLGLGLGLTAVAAYGTYKLLTDKKSEKPIQYDRNNP